MIKANFNAYNNYVTDSLYQWDLNQVLSVSGLNLSVVPEVHFSNSNMEKALVRQATTINGVIYVDIPNSLLQDPLMISAHIGIYENDTFKVVELISIPVIPRERPSDYQIQDKDEEVYSFNALANALANTAKVGDLKTVNARIDNIIVNATSTNNNTELIDIRTDIDGTIHDSAGTAVREQVANLRKYNPNATVFLNNPPVVTKTASELTVSFTGDTIVFFNSTYYIFTDITISTTTSGTLFNLLYDLVTGKVSLQYYKTPIPDNNVMLGCIYQETMFLNSVGKNTWGFMSEVDSVNPIFATLWSEYEPTVTYVDDTSGNRVITLKLPTSYIESRNAGTLISERTVTSTVTSSGSLYKILYNIAEDDVRIIAHGVDNPKGYFTIGLWHNLFGLRMNTYRFGNRSINLTLAPLILGAGNMFVEIDTVNKTITFPNDTLIQCNRDNRRNYYKLYYQLTDSAGNTSVSWEKSASSAQIVFFNTDTELLGTCTYGERPPENAIILAAMRTSNGQVSINAPYKINGKPFNFNASDIGAVDITTETGVYHVKGVNHRGYCTEAPENTLSAYKLSKKKGFNYVECDVSFTSDGVPVLLHDATIDRTSNGTGNINELTFDEVRTLDFGSWFSEDYTGEKIPKFDEFILLCRNLGLHPYIEIKSSAVYTQDQIETLVNIVKRAGMSDKVTWISFNATYLGYVKNVNRKARLGYVVDTITEAVVLKATELKTEENDVFIDSNYGTLTDELVTLCINADIPLEVWTVNNEASITSLNCYISGVTSDNIIAGRTLMDNNLT